MGFRLVDIMQDCEWNWPINGGFYDGGRECREFVVRPVIFGHGWFDVAGKPDAEIKHFWMDQAQRMAKQFSYVSRR